MEKRRKVMQEAKAQIAIIAARLEQKSGKISKPVEKTPKKD